MIRNHRLSRTQRRRLVLRTRAARRHACVSHLPISRGRQGSTLLVVMVLLGLLTVLGVIFYTFAAQERSNSEYYAEAAKNVEDPGLSADVLMDWGLQQLIIGTDPRLKNSALWGSRHSMLSNAMGVGDHRVNDLHPYNGEGINLIDDGTGSPTVDQNRDGTPDGTFLLGFNDSPAANLASGRPIERRLYPGNPDGIPQPDVGYTYPDINNLFLTYVGWSRHRGTGAAYRVVIPAFHRPQYLRNPSGGGSPYPAGAAVGTNWYDHPDLINRVMRPHPEHRFVPSMNAPGTPNYRFIRTDAEATALLGAGGKPFPWMPMSSAYPAAPPAGWSGTQGIWSGPGIDANGDGGSDVSDYLQPQFDVDNDKDGVREGVWLDLDFPVQEQPGTGKLFVPIYSFTVHDLDALINLNAHGNLAKLTHDHDVLNFLNMNSTGEFVSQSNLGLSASEVNPGWVLNGRPGVDHSTALATVFDQHFQFYQATPAGAGTGPAPDWRQSANMELVWLKMGRPELSGPTNVDELYPGVYGEEHLIYQAVSAGSKDPLQYPRPGQSQADDNGDLLYGMSVQTASITDADQFGLYPFTNFRHPLDFTGLGRYSQTGVNRKALLTGNNGQVRWPAYSKYTGSGNGAPGNERIFWGSNFSRNGGLMFNTAANVNRPIQSSLYDDPNEVAYYSTDRRGIDDVLGPDETMYLQLTNSEIDTLGVPSRVQKLAPFNFAKDPGLNSRGYDIRKKFTTSSNDRREYALPMISGGPDGMPGNGSDSIGDYGASGSDDYGRAWEYCLPLSTFTNQQAPRFPPVPRTISAYSTTDPFRRPVRYLLENSLSADGPLGLMRRLNMNRLLTLDDDDQLLYRELTPHPYNPGQTPIPSSAPYPPTTDAHREYWARRDRQMLARDIYVLLYLLGGGCDDQTDNDHAGPIGVEGYLKSNAANELYTPEQLREMAQFAVNFVDRLDTDNVITRFEYDTDLSDGWGLDDNPYTTTETVREEVFGVEAQELTINEALAFHQPELTTDHARTTAVIEGTGINPYYAYVELRNVAPYRVEFTDNAAWQILIRGQNPTTADRQLRLKAAAGGVDAGSLYTIGSLHYTGVASGDASASRFLVDTDGDSAGNDIAPVTGAPNLNILVNSPTSYYQITDSANPPADRMGTVSDWFNASTFPATGEDVRFVLRRRVHPTRQGPSVGSAPEEDDNPWVEVDSMRIDNGDNLLAFNLEAADNTNAMVEAKLNALRSRYRTEPFKRSSEASFGMGANGIWNAIGQNAPATTAMTVIQNHVDRDYGSVGELLLVPTSSPAEITRDVEFTRYSPLNQINNGGVVNGAGKMLLPNPTPATPATNNRWYRLLEFLEVPTRANQNLGQGTDLEITRTPGKINLNMLRYPEILAALVDDHELIQFFLDASVADSTSYPAAVDPAESGVLQDQFESSPFTAREWWAQFLQSRDGADPLWGGQLDLPGLPGSKPFRPLSYTQSNLVSGTPDNPIDETLLRNLPADTTSSDMARRGDPRGLFEVGTWGQHSSNVVNADPPDATTALDPAIRYGILSKLMGNTTTRSHCFAVFISVKYFEAAEQNGAIRIGGPLEKDDGTYEPEYRGFFVVDRSLLEQGNQSGGTGFSTFKPFVTHRKILQEP